ncbi:hypothetical protein IAR50_004874 [Cryptococcus sp. DSM 104548]
MRHPTSSPSPSISARRFPPPTLKSSPFKTPSSTKSSGKNARARKLSISPKSAGISSVTIEEKLVELQKEVSELRDALGDKDPNKIVQQHIHLLHTYNEIKDGTQSLIGRYALMTNRTIKDVHEELRLPLTDE